MKKWLFLSLFLFCKLTYGQTKVVVVNSEMVLDTMPSRKWMIAEISKMEADGYRELARMDSIYYSRLERIPCFGNEDYLKKLKSIQREIQQLELDLDSQIERMIKESVEKSRNILETVVKNIAEREGYELVLKNSEILNFNTYIDITPIVIREVLKMESLTPFSYQ